MSAKGMVRYIMIHHCSLYSQLTVSSSLIRNKVLNLGPLMFHWLCYLRRNLINLFLGQITSQALANHSLTPFQRMQISKFGLWRAAAGSLLKASDTPLLKSGRVKVDQDGRHNWTRMSKVQVSNNNLHISTQMTLLQYTSASHRSCQITNFKEVPKEWGSARLKSKFSHQIIIWWCNILKTPKVWESVPPRTSNHKWRNRCNHKWSITIKSIASMKNKRTWASMQVSTRMIQVICNNHNITIHNTTLSLMILPHN